MRIAQKSVTEQMDVAERINETDNMLKQIAQLTKEREELAIQLRAWNSCFGTSQLTHASSLLDCAIRERDKLKSHSDQLAAKCAEMRDALRKSWVNVTSETSVSEQIKQFESARLHSLSDQCGQGWIGPEQKKMLVGLIQRCDDYLAGVVSFLPTRTEFKQALEACSQ